MLNEKVEWTAAKILGIGAALITVFLLTESLTDPVNVTKFFLLGVVACSSAVLIALQQRETLLKDLKYLLLLIFMFCLFMLNSAINSESPLTQNFYGAYGRNNGLLTYLFLSLILISAATLRKNRAFKILLQALLVAGLINILYCAWVLVFGDFLSWDNPYKKILGTFGNPDFISAFLGMVITGMVAWAFNKSVNWRYRLIVLILTAIASYEIHASHAIQGKVVAVVGISIVGFYFLRSKFESVIPTLTYFGLVIVAGIFAALGALQIGPLTKYIYKVSVSLRGEYWQAGINMGLDKPWTGVGMDSYGDYYRAFRDESALTLPGKSVITNVAHNVVIDFFASGGWPLFTSYLLLLVAGVVSILRVTKRQKEYEPAFVGLTAVWICYQAQSIISINQIGLAVWGWLFTGALIGYEISTRQESIATLQPTAANRTKKHLSKESIISPALLASLGAIAGAIIAIPPLSSDTSWASAIKTGNYNLVQAAATPSYLHPQNTNRYLNLVDVLNRSQLMEQARAYAFTAVEFNPKNYDSWYMIYALGNSTPAEKEKAKAKLQELDPFNPDVTKP